MEGTCGPWWALSKVHRDREELHKGYMRLMYGSRDMAGCGPKGLGCRVLCVKKRVEGSNLRFSVHSNKALDIYMYIYVYIPV